MSFLLDFLAISAYRWRIDRGVAQLVEQRPPKPWAEGSSPSTPVQALCHVHEAFFLPFFWRSGAHFVMHTHRKYAFCTSILACWIIALAFSSPSHATPRESELSSSTTYLAAGISHRLALFSLDLPRASSRHAFAVNGIFFGLHNDWSHYSLRLVANIELNASTMPLAYSHHNRMVSTSFVSGVGIGAEFSFYLLPKNVDVFVGMQATAYFIRYRGGFFAFDARLGLEFVADRHASTWMGRARFKVFASFPVYSALGDVFSIEFFDVSPGIELGFVF